MAYAHQQTFRPQQSRDNLAPGFLSRSNQQLVTLSRTIGPKPATNSTSMFSGVFILQSPSFLFPTGFQGLYLQTLSEIAFAVGKLAFALRGTPLCSSFFLLSWFPLCP